MSNARYVGCVGARCFGSLVDKSEVAKFSRQMNSWWDAEAGPSRALHQLNPLRVRFVRQFVCDVLEKGPLDPHPLLGVSVLDVGCGGGLLSEALARLGADVVGLDASQKAVEIAQAHAKDAQFRGSLRYVHGNVEDMVERFDLVVCSEVIEHVPNVERLVQILCSLNAGGKVGCVFSTLNRTAVSYALGIIVGEYVLGLVPPGTHDWNKFVTPEELRNLLAQESYENVSIRGLRYNPWIAPYWNFTNILDVNYIASFRRNHQ